MRRLIIFLLMLISCNCYAVLELRGNNLLKYCNGAMNILDNKTTYPSSTDFSNAYTCLGYIRGIDDMHTVASVWVNGKNAKYPEGRLKYCMPDTSFDQNISIVVKYLKDHPSELDEPAVTLVLHAYEKAFPCE